ncbi:hypothetical protein, partial [Sulfuriferula multivorans]|uniref:hypothetical protein n=1 Tax=Sulfuriferula multivorans TaxID=1559896 RepID=UPI001CB96A6B
DDSVDYPCESRSSSDFYTKKPSGENLRVFYFKAMQSTGFKTQLFASQMRAVRSWNHTGVELTRWRFGANGG